MGDENTMTGNALHRVITCLDKRTEGEPITLDWNAFDAVTPIKDTELRDVARRLLPDLEFVNIRRELEKAIVKKRREMLAVAKDRVLVKMIDECIRLKLTTTAGIEVTTKESLKQYFKESSDETSAQAIHKITYLCFSQSPRWKEDTTDYMIERFGIGYDLETVRTHENGRGNGFYEKITTKALCNLRADLRAAQGRANRGFAVPRIRRNADDAYDDEGRYIRKKHYR